jgi:ketosteroid isomerase-like protein
MSDMHTTAIEAGVEEPAAARLRRFFAQMDSEDPHRVLSWMSDAFEFTVLFSTGADVPVTEFRGGIAEWRDYLAQRPAEERPWHELAVVAGADDIATAFGRTRLGPDVVAAFTATLKFDGAGNIVRYFAARTPNLVL